MKRLIVTADDLGLAKSINKGIVRACNEGIVTAVSVIPTGEAFEDALSVIKDLPVKDFGAHLALSETEPVLSSFKFNKNHNTFFLKLLLGLIKPYDIYEELKAQIELLKNAGLKITHINSHEHVHLIPKVLDIFIRLANEYGIKAIRFPRIDRPPEEGSLAERYKLFVLDYFSSRIEKDLSESGLVYTDHFIGLLDAGRLDLNKIVKFAGVLHDGVTELVTHPGFLSPEILDRYSWHKYGETELFALTDRRVKSALKANNIELVSYETFISSKK